MRNINMQRMGIIAVLFLVIFLLSCSQNRSRYLTSAQKVSTWLESVSQKTEYGKVWPADPATANSISYDLYHGTPGVILFYTELYKATASQKYLENAIAGADHLLQMIPQQITSQNQAGLYTGVAGIGFVLEEIYHLTGDTNYRQSVLDCVQILKESSKKAGEGIEWGSVTDIISGNAGIGLFLLYAWQNIDDDSIKELAYNAGLRLLEVGEQRTGGMTWDMDSNYPRQMPNFAHGTAGIAYFLLSLYDATKFEKFLEGAIAGGNYLRSITNSQGLIYHNEPDGRDLFYLGWCHGPAGTARLYYKLFEVTKDSLWMEAMIHSLEGVYNSGIPEQQTPGFWNNISQCCGSAGVADTFLHIYFITNDRRYLDFSLKMTDDLLARATIKNNGICWIQAEHRVRPELLIAQTGYMQGAAGVGTWLLKLHAKIYDKEWTMVLPDSPF